MKNHILFIFFIISIFQLSCECEELPIIDPNGVIDPFIADIISENDNLLITFNKKIDTTSIQLNENLFLVGDGILFNGNYSFFFFPTYDVIQISSCDLGCMDDPIQCSVSIRLTDEVKAIKTINGQTLDGDKNGTDGGDQEETVFLENCDVPLVTPFQVVSPDLGFEGSIYFPGYVDTFIILNFNEAVDTSTFIFFETVLFELDNGLSDLELRPDFALWNSDLTSVRIRFTLEEEGDNVSQLDQLNLILKGTDTGLGSIKSIAGQELDGDLDGVPGGDFFTIVNYGVFPYVIFPEANQDSSSNFTVEYNPPSESYSVVIDLLFNVLMDTFTFQTNETIILETRNFDYTTYSPVPFNLVWGGELSSVQIYSDFEITCPTSFCSFRLKVKNTKGLNGIILDGDQDEIEGGEYEIMFFY